MLGNLDFNSLIVALVVAVVPVVVAWLLKDVLGVFTTYLKAKAKNEKVAMWIDKLDDIAAESVLMVSQTFVSTLKEYGKFDIVAQRTAFERARENVKALINDEGKELLMEVYGDLDQLIRTKIEANVIAFKG